MRPATPRDSGGPGHELAAGLCGSGPSDLLERVRAEPGRRGRSAEG
ncbi:hypothetical protein BN2537_2999 [Streptomyces venezuelae]|nr:hypothetical protein BN2537_2999 [Streptomyces venezuelae]